MSLQEPHAHSGIHRPARPAGVSGPVVNVAFTHHGCCEEEKTCGENIISTGPGGTRLMQTIYGGAGRLCDEQNFVRSTAVRCIKVPSGAGKTEIQVKTWVGQQWGGLNETTGVCAVGFRGGTGDNGGSSVRPSRRALSGSSNRHHDGQRFNRTRCFKSTPTFLLRRRDAGRPAGRRLCDSVQLGAQWSRKSRQ